MCLDDGLLFFPFRKRKTKMSHWSPLDFCSCFAMARREWECHSFRILIFPRLSKRVWKFECNQNENYLFLNMIISENICGCYEWDFSIEDIRFGIFFSLFFSTFLQFFFSFFLFYFFHCSFFSFVDFFIYVVVSMSFICSYFVCLTFIIFFILLCFVGVLIWVFTFICNFFWTNVEMWWEGSEKSGE